MGLWNDIKKEWTWASIKENWRDYVAVFMAAIVAQELSKGGTWLWFLLWVVTFVVTRFVLLIIVRLVKHNHHDTRSINTANT